jgi:hypothetical protein
VSVLTTPSTRIRSGAPSDTIATAKPGAGGDRSTDGHLGFLGEDSVPKSNRAYRIRGLRPAAAPR